MVGQLKVRFVALNSDIAGLVDIAVISDQPQRK